MKYPKAGDLQRATGVQITSNPSPKYSERRGWTGGDSRTLYAIEDQRTGRVVVRPGGELAGIGSEAVVRIATRAEAEEHWQGQLHAGWHVAESNPHAPKQNPWEVHSDSGLEGVFFDEDSARFYAEEIRGGGARGIRVERRVKRLPHRNPPSGRWADASLTITNIAQNMEVLGVSGCNSLLKYVPVEVAGVGYGWLFKCLPDGHDVIVEMDGGGMQTVPASQVTPVGGRVPESPTQLALRAKYKAKDEEERRERGNPSGMGDVSWRSVAGIAGNWNVEQQDQYGRWKVTDRDVSHDYAEKTVAWVEKHGGTARAVQGNPIEMHENPARVTRERYGDSADIVIEHNRYGYTGWLESKRGGGRRPISFGATRPTNAQEALALARKFLASVHGRNNPGVRKVTR